MSRLARIYSVLLPVLAATWVLDLVAKAVDPAVFSPSWDYVGDSLRDYLPSLLLVNELWFVHAPPGSDHPVWSLGYEACTT